MEVALPIFLSIEIVKDLILSDEESSDEEEVLSAIVILTKKSRKKPPRIENYVEETVHNFSARQFQQNFRVSIEAYEHLIRVVGPLLQRKRQKGRLTIDVDKQLLAVLWLLATPDSYRSVGEMFDMGKSSLSVCFIRVVRVLCSLSERVIVWPFGERLRAAKDKFRRMAGLPDVIGAVDGTYVNIKAPKDDPESYITRKCQYAITLQAICDPNLRFTDVFVGFPGSVNDNRIFRNSDIYVAVRNNMEHYFPEEEFIIGDRPTLAFLGAYLLTSIEET